MSQTVAQRLDRMARHAIPLLSTLMLALACAVPLGVPEYPHVVPFYTAMAVFYWAVYRPDLMPLAGIFAAGLLQDILTGAPMGLSALLLLLIHGAAVSQRRVFLGRPFFIAWFGFAVLAAGAAIVAWLAASVLAAAVVPPMPVVFQAVITAALFPAAAAVFVGAHRHLVREPA